ncbi:MAG: hypothetical protein M0R17_02085 [Candidatus Omnitrophica bacterium]|jgi:hypothetical protein|nr:hypothetical protein [Candidatus Omnitrophota bacterium]
MGWKKYEGQDLKVNNIVALKGGETAIVVSHSIHGNIAEGLDALPPASWSCNFVVDKILNKKSGLQKSGWVYNVYGEPIHKITHVFTLPKLKK